MTRLLISTLLIAALTFTSPAAAQDGSEATAQRTVEGAQRFLAEFYAQAGARVKSGGYSLNGHWSVNKLVGSKHEMAEGPVVKFDPADRCKSRFQMAPAIAWRWRESDRRVPIAADAGNLTVDLDWSKIQKLEVKNDWYFEEGGSGSVNTGYFNVIIWMKAENNTASLFVVHPTRADADRAAFAMQFLAEQCGFKSDTGF